MYDFGDVIGGMPVRFPRFGLGGVLSLMPCEPYVFGAVARRQQRGALAVSFRTTFRLMLLVRTLAEADAPLLTKPFFAGGDPGPITATMAHVPELVELALPFIGAVLSPSAIGWRTKEIVILRTSWLMRCRYCIESHTPVALDSGLSSAQVHALRDEESLDDAFPDGRDRLLIEWTDAVATGPGLAPEGLRQRMVQTYSEAEIVELTLLVGVTLLLNRYATSLGLPVGEATIARLSADGFVRS